MLTRKKKQPETKELALAGQPSAPAVFTSPEEVRQIQTLLSLLDTNPRIAGLREYRQLQRENPGALNRDFVVIEGQIEIKRDFALKVRKTMGLSYTVEKTAFNDTSEGLIFTCVVMVDGVAGTGACATSEVKEKARGKHAHFAQAIAETRAFKRALENRVGLPIVNTIIEQLFGGFDVEDAKRMRRVGPQAEAQRSPAVRDKLQAIHAQLREAVEDGHLSEPEGASWWERFKAAGNNLALVSTLEGKLAKLLMGDADE